VCAFFFIDGSVRGDWVNLKEVKGEHAPVKRKIDFAYAECRIDSS
jgi:hypothetical protein